MRVRTSLVISIVGAVFTTGGMAVAQDNHDHGGWTPTPEMQAAREAMHKACAADADTLCHGKEGREMMQCLRDNGDKVSPGCKDAMSKMPHHHHEG